MSKSTKPRYKIVLNRSADKQFYFNIVYRGNGQVIATSERYTRKKSMLDTVKGIKNDPTFEVEYDQDLLFS